MRYHYVSIQMAETEKKNHYNECQRVCETKEILIPYQWGCKSGQPLGKAVAISASTEYIDPQLSRNSNHGDIPNRNAEIAHDVCKNICRNIICNIPKLATSQTSIGISMGKYIYKSYPIEYRRQYKFVNVATINNSNKTHKQYAAK